VALYPNPSHEPKVYVAISTEVQIEPRVYSSMGTIMPVEVRETGNSLEISFSKRLHPGIYFIVVGDKTLKWIYQY
jgi:Secretion system C-terminal sorting domain